MGKTPSKPRPNHVPTASQARPKHVPNASQARPERVPKESGASPERCEMGGESRGVVACCCRFCAVFRCLPVARSVVSPFFFRRGRGCWLFVFGRRLSDAEVCSPDLPDRLAEGFAAAVPVFRFLATLR